MKNEPYRKVFAFEKLHLIHLSGLTEHIPVKILRQQRAEFVRAIKDNQADLKIIDNDIAKVHTKNPIRRMMIKRKLKHKDLLKENHDPFNP